MKGQTCPLRRPSKERKKSRHSRNDSNTVSNKMNIYSFGESTRDIAKRPSVSQQD